jgi:hypothetical protein
VPGFLVFVKPTYATGLSNRSLQIGTSQPSATTTYTFQFDITDPSVLGSIELEFCSNSPIPGDACNPPAGLDVSSAVLSNQTGETAFPIAPGATANYLVLTRPPAVPTPQVASYQLDGVVNPSTPETTNYVRVQTFVTDDASGPSSEDGGIAYAITQNFSISAFVPPFLQFCVGISITGTDCLTATGSFIDFGILTEFSASLATSQMVGATNGYGGLAVAVIGTTMTSGINAIPALNTRSVSVPGTSQFGLNLRANTNPSVGTNPSGPGTTVPNTDYNVVNQFTFRDGDIIANSSLSTNYTKLTASYLVNISSAQAAGVYTSTLTYVATASF